MSRDLKEMSKPSVETASQEEGKQVYWPRGMIVLCMFED